MINVSKVIFDNKKSFFYLYNHINLCDLKIQNAIENILYTVVTYMGLDAQIYFPNISLKLEYGHDILNKLRNKLLYDLLTYYFPYKNIENYNMIEIVHEDNSLVDNMLNAKEFMHSKLDTNLESTIVKILNSRNSNGTFGSFKNFNELLLSSSLALLVITEFLIYRLDNMNYV